jgi:hypothetical protein
MRLSHQTVFERRCGIGREPKQKTPNRLYKCPLENDCAEHGCENEYYAAKKGTRNDSRQPKPYKQTE